MKRNKGTTLLETLISTLIFSVLAIAVFALFDIGKMKWNVMYLRHQLQNDVRKSASALERDLRKTHYGSVDIYTNPSVSPPGWGTTQVARWATCMVGVDDWSKPANFDPISGKPIWNEYLVYLATLQTDQGGGGPLGPAGSGLFVRLALHFNASPTIPLPLHYPLCASTVTWIDNEFSTAPQNGIFSSAQRVAPPLLLSGFGLGLIPGSKVAASSFPCTLDGSIGTCGGGTVLPFFSDIETPLASGKLEEARQTAITDTDASLSAFKGTIPPDTKLSLLSADIKSLGTMFSFAMFKDDTNRVVQATLKTKGYVSRSPQAMGGSFESRQINLNIAPASY